MPFMMSARTSVPIISAIFSIFTLLGYPQSDLLSISLYNTIYDFCFIRFIRLENFAMIKLMNDFKEIRASDS